MSADRIPARLRRISSVAALFTAAASVSALIGWSTGIASLREVLPGAVSMNPLTAVGLLITALALWLAAHPSERTAQPRRLMSTLVIGIGLLRLVELVEGVQVGADLVLFRGQILDLTPVPRMAYSTAICLLSLGIVLLTYQDHARRRAIRILVVPAAIFALVASAGYIYQAEWFVSLPALRPMAFNSALALLALCLGITALPPAVAPADKLVFDGVVGTAARRLIPAAFFIPLVLGYLRVYGEREGFFDLGFGTAAFVVLTAILLSFLSYWSVGKVMRADTAQRRLQEAVAASERRLFQILEAIPVGLFVVNREGHPYYANQKSTALLGRGIMPEARPEDLPEIYQVYHTGTTRPLSAAEVPVLRALQGEEVHTTEVEIHRPDGIVPLEVWASPIPNQDGTIEFGVAAFNDISERLRSARQITELNAELHHQVAELGMVNRELETFSYSVSHDLRAPLRAIDGFSRMLESDHGPALPDDARRLLERIRGNTRRMGALIDDLLRFSRLSRADLVLEEVNMTGLVDNVVEDIQRHRPHSAIIKVAPLPPARGDISLLRQVWVNLIENAIKYSGGRADPRIEITGARTDNTATYAVRDNGVGFDMAYADKLFGVFQRLHRQDEFEGTGVGLAIVQRVIHRHGGTVRAHAVPNEGAVFTFTLPAEGTDGGP